MNGHKIAPEDNSQAFQMSGTTQETIKAMMLERSWPGQIPQFTSSRPQALWFSYQSSLSAALLTSLFYFKIIVKLVYFIFKII